MARIAYASLLVFVFSIPWETVFLIPGLGTGSRLTGMAAFPLCLMAILIKGRHHTSAPFLLLGLFVAFAMLSITWSENLEYGPIVVMSLLQLLAMVWVTLQIVERERQLHGMFLAYVLGAFVAAIGAVRSFQSGTFEGYQRYAIEGADPNDMALILAVAIAMAGYLAVVRGGWWRLIALGFIPVGSYAILLSASRAGFLAMLAALALPILLLLRPFRLPQVIVLCVLGLAAGSALLTFSDYVPDYSLERITTIGAEVTGGTLNGRLQIWAAALEVLNDAPFVGVGIASFGPAAGDYLAGWQPAAHNVFLSIAVEYGIVGLLIVVAAWALVMREVLRMPFRERLAWLVILLGVLLIAMMSVNWELKKTSWLLLALALAHARCLAGTQPLPRVAHQDRAPPEAIDGGGVSEVGLGGGRAQSQFRQYARPRYLPD